MATPFPSAVVKVTSSGLTAATTAYSAGDCVGAGFTIDMTQTNGVLTDLTLEDDSDVIAGYYLGYIFDASITFGTDNAAPSISDADAQKFLGRVEFAPADDLGGCRVANLDSIAQILKPAASTSVFLYLQTLAGHTFFGASTALHLIAKFALGA